MSSSETTQEDDERSQEAKRARLSYGDGVSFVEILERPVSYYVFGREGIPAGSIPGASSSPGAETFTTIRLVGYELPAVLEVSCVTIDEPPRPHPHNLVGPGCKRGVYKTEIPLESRCVTLRNLGIQRVKPRDVESVLLQREEDNVNPFNTGFDHKKRPSSIDYNAVRLCFRVFTEDESTGKFTMPIKTVTVSLPIYDNTPISSLKILKSCDVNVVSKDIKEVAKEEVLPPLDDREKLTFGPFVQIVEQPAPAALRFRYKCEGRHAGSIPGVSSTLQRKTYPSIQVVGYRGPAVVQVSCVTIDKPYRPHPHRLVGREGCERGICTLPIPPDSMCVTFSNLGIQCAKKKAIESVLNERKDMKIDPFMTGFDHAKRISSIDLNGVRLCFQVFLGRPDHFGIFKIPLPPVVSQPVYDKKAMYELAIVKLSHRSCEADGGTDEIILLCEKVSREDIEVRFFEEKGGRVIWEAYGDFQPSEVHKQTAICFKPPPYRQQDISEPVNVLIELRRPSDGVTSVPLLFTYLPLNSAPPARVKRRVLRSLDSRMTSNSEDMCSLPSISTEKYS